MPNEVSNKLYLDGDPADLDKLTKFVEGENGAMDFSKIIPSPGKCDDLYHWRCLHWGTKWNAVDAMLNGTVFRFITAWSAPLAVIKALSKLFPNVGIKIKWSDEGVGNNCGEAEFYEGGMTDIYSPCSRSEQRIFFEECWDVSSDDD